MQDIFQMQMKLNITTLANIGLDFKATMADDELRPVWIENYRKALSAELAELVREVHSHGIGTRNGVVEVVDMLHFLVSLSHVVGVEADEVVLGATAGSSFEDCAIRTFLALDELQSSVKWKWWAKGGGFKPEAARRAVLELWACFDRMCAVAGVDFETLKRVYEAKNAVNFKRQAQGYNEDTKSEDDNRSIRV